MSPDLLEATSPLWPAVCGFLVLACLRTDASGFVVLTSMSAAGFLLCSCLSSPLGGGGRRGEEGVVASARVSGASVENPRRKRAMEEREEKGGAEEEQTVRHSTTFPHSRGHAASLPPRQTRDSQQRLREALMDDLFGEGRR